MMDLLAWQRLTVEEFFQRHSWLSSTRSQVTPNHGEGGAEPVVAERVALGEVTQPNWQRLSVGEFLQRWNWQAKPQHLSSAHLTVSQTPVSTEEMTAARPESLASSSWLQLPLQAFIDSIPWQAQPQRKVAAPAPSLVSPAVSSEPTRSQFSPPLPSLAWQSLTVQEFFTQNAWSGQAIAPSVAQTEFRPAQSSLKATVAQFFQAFPWESIPSIAALPALEPLTPPQQPNLSLNDLSDLF